MKRFIKGILLSITSVLLLTGCTGFFGPTKKGGASADNLDDEVIISQVKEQLKKNMNQLGFEVNVDDYNYQVKAAPQTFSTFGSVSMRDKRYEYAGYVNVYSGNFGSKKKKETIQFEKVSRDPLSFVAPGYANYIIENMFNNEAQGNNIDNVKKVTEGEILPYVLDYHHVYENQEAEVYNPDFAINQKYINNSTFFNSTKKINPENYFKLFQGQNNKEFNYEMLRKNMGYVANVGIYVDTTDDKISELKEQIKNLYNKEIIAVTVTNYKRK